jgi:hypothetical protein
MTLQALIKAGCRAACKGATYPFDWPVFSAWVAKCRSKIAAAPGGLLLHQALNLPTRAFHFVGCRLSSAAEIEW